ncbi:protein-tyrosine-phosphatase [Chitinophaga sp.]|uniref:protein-tyrosine-phosphatase n=1 Tax=Chitinophaga sp. TaxID=1869181 RepID=UPI0031D76C3C
MHAQLLPAITQYLKQVEKDFDLIAPERRTELQKIADGVRLLLHEKGQAALIYICTHNSRRSHMGQLWAMAAATYYNIKGISSYSGGTEITAFNPNAIKALQEAGFEIGQPAAAANPHYNIVYAEGAPAVIAFSKKYMDAPNPTSNFIAVMTCSHADDNCPFVTGASLKVATPYEDPKAGDGKPEQEQVYRERCRQIATEVLYSFYLVVQGN